MTPLLSVDTAVNETIVPPKIHKVVSTHSSQSAALTALQQQQEVAMNNHSPLAIQACQRDTNGNWLCPACHAAFTRRQNMVRHAEQLCGVTIPKPDHAPSAFIQIVMLPFYFKTQLIEHMAAKHDKEVHCEILTFKTLAQF